MKNNFSKDEQKKGKIKTPEIPWQDFVSKTIDFDAESRAFKNDHLPTLLDAFYQNHYENLIPVKTLDTDGRDVRVYHIANQGFDENTRVFIHNENSDGVDNLELDFRKLTSMDAGNFADFPARKYRADYGGLLADIFFLKGNTLIGTGFGTNAFTEYTSSNVTVHQIKKTNIYFVQLKLGQTIRYAFAIVIK